MKQNPTLVQTPLVPHLPQEATSRLRFNAQRGQKGLDNVWILRPGTTITTVSGTDPEGQSITFGTSSLYTDDLVRVASNGVMTLNALAESSSFNTDLVGGVHGHKVEVTVTDSFGTTTEKDIYVIWF